MGPGTAVSVDLLLFNIYNVCCVSRSTTDRLTTAAVSDNERPCRSTYSTAAAAAASATEYSSTVLYQICSFHR